MKPAADSRMTVIRADSKVYLEKAFCLSSRLEQHRRLLISLGQVVSFVDYPSVSCASLFLLLPIFFTLPLKKGLTKEEKSTFQVNSFFESMHPIVDELRNPGHLCIMSEGWGCGVEV